VTTSSAGIEQLKQGMRAAWMAGDFGKIAEYSAKDAEAFVETLGITPQMQVLDVACGTGNLALPAARKGANVTGVDIAPNLLDQARQRAAAEGLEIAFEEGDAEQLPFPDEQFDLVMSMFGAMFAPRPERVASELARVCRHGGKIAMANWTPDSFPGIMFRLSHRYLPPPAGLPAPVLWGDEAVVRERFNANGVQVETKRHTILFDYPFPPSDVVQFFRAYFGPTKMAFARLDAAGQAAYSNDLEKLWAEYNQSDCGKTLIHNDYLEVIGTRQ
jgi:ubiquinone/menaquinone biosynthesis C-methylase UbiE